jgi:hypothetical protein
MPTGIKWGNGIPLQNESNPTLLSRSAREWPTILPHNAALRGRHVFLALASENAGLRVGKFSGLATTHSDGPPLSGIVTIASPREQRPSEPNPSRQM